MENLNISVSNGDMETFVTLSGSMTLMDALELKCELSKLIEVNESLVIDINNVDDIDLTGLNSLLVTKVLCDEQNVDLIVNAVDNHPLYELLLATKFNNQFSFRNAIMNKYVPVAC